MSTITAIILSGGQGSRMAYQNKGMVKLDNKAMIEHVIERLLPQVDNVIISANQDMGKYRQYGFQVIGDLEKYRDNGPLAGIFSCAKQTQLSDFFQIATCDSPFLPENLTQKLKSDLADNRSIAVPFDGERLQPLHMLLPVTATQSMGSFLDNNMRSVHKWLSKQSYQSIDFSNNNKLFANINTMEELEQSASS